MLTVYFGADLDGYHPFESSARCGEVNLGPLGLLGLLEARLALNKPQVPQSTRVVQYRACLKQLDDGRRFYSASFAADPQTTSSTLLQWRDTWIAGGWQGTCAPDHSPALRDLAAVEASGAGRLSPGLYDRLRMVLETLRRNPLKDVKVHIVHDPMLLPYLWRELLSALGTEILRPDFLASPEAEGETDLHRLQLALGTQHPVELHGDGSVILLTAHNETTLARAVNQIIHNQVEACDNSWFPLLSATLLHDGQTRVLDDIFSGGDAPRAGLPQASSWRPPLQVLPLALSLLWEPLDPYRLLEFLTHPVGPLPRRVKNRMARVVAEQPGTGGVDWNDALDELIAEETARKDGDVKAGDALKQRINSWLAIKRHSPSSGAPLEIIAERCAEVARWAAATAELQDLSPAGKALLYAASAQAGQACEVLDLLRAEGESHLSKLQLERLLDQVTAAGTSVATRQAELGHVLIRTSPGAVIETNERLVWWQFTEPTLPSRSPWSNDERQQLEAADVHLPNNQELLALLSKQWLQPVFAAKKQIVFAVPRTLHGEAMRHHPLWDMIETLSGQSLPRIEVTETMSLPPEERNLPLAVDQLTFTPLPGPKRWWKLPKPAVLTPRNKPESYSSLDKFINSPYQWVLNYKAGLYPAKIERIDPKTQRGNLLHSLVEQLFTGGCDWRQADESTVKSWATSAFEKLLAEEGANLLLPGRLKERLELVHIAGMTVWELIRALRAAEVVSAVTEKEVTGSFTGGELTGFIDLFVVNEDGKEAVIDLKWGGGKYRKELLQKNLALQLALYASLSQKQGRWPAQAFFILEEGRLLAQDRQYFPTAEVCAPADPNAGAQSLWADFEKTWRWRREQLDKGLIEVTVEGTSADAVSTSPAMPIEEHNDRFNDFDALTGWQEGA